MRIYQAETYDGGETLRIMGEKVGQWIESDAWSDVKQ